MSVGSTDDGSSVGPQLTGTASGASTSGAAQERSPQNVMSGNVLNALGINVKTNKKLCKEWNPQNVFGRTNHMRSSPYEQS
jgi:hypothetical protein